MSRWSVVFSLLLLAASPPAATHHSRAMFDMAQNITLRGTVREYRWQDPHSHLIVDVGNQTFDIEASAISLMTTRGWTRVTYRPRDPITVVTHPNRNGSRNVLLFYVIRPDGSRLYRAANRYPLEVEEPAAADTPLR